MGKGTIDKKSSGETKGRQGSSSRNYDVLGRELFTPDEVRKLDNKKCIIFIRGFDPIMDDKFIPFTHPAFAQTADGKGKPYVHTPRENKRGQAFQLLSPRSVSYYEGLKEKGENIHIDSIMYEDLALLAGMDMKKRFMDPEEQEQAERFYREQDNELAYPQEAGMPPGMEGREAEKPQAGKPDERKQKPTAGNKEAPARKAADRGRPEGGDSILNRMAQWEYSGEQKEELHKMLAAGMPVKTILAVFYPETDAAKMREIRKTFQAAQAQQEGEAPI